MGGLDAAGGPGGGLGGGLGGGRPFDGFREGLVRRDPLRRAITAAALRSEPELVAELLEPATLAPEALARAQDLARRLIGALRAKGPSGGVEGLIREYDLSSEEGVALMCLAEALLRIPDAETRDALIRDKIGGGDWRAHLGRSPSVFVNAATWGLLVTGRLTATASERGLGSALVRLIGRGGEPLIRAGVDLAMRLLGERFVAGETIERAIARGRAFEDKGFRYSYDMLGEAAASAEDASRYFAAYDHAIRAIGQAAKGEGVRARPGVSIKLSALHPRYARSQRGRVMAELYPRLAALARLARRYDVGLNIDAEEADRLELSLDIIEALAFEPDLDRWDGVGFVVQAYGRRAPLVVDWLVELGRRSRRRLMVRLVKGAYWDSEIKRAQTLGLDDFPVFTRKAHTDLCYLACARKLLSAPDAVYPQFATHNALTLAMVREVAGLDAGEDAYEFQCLHGMGEPLYEEMVGDPKLSRPCRIYAPVGGHETLLAYLVRRLLENGANASFVHRVADEAVDVESLIADPAAAVRSHDPPGAPHDGIRAPRALFAPDRENSKGVDLADEDTLKRLADALEASAARGWFAGPALADGPRDGARRPVRNPARRDDVVGYVVDAGQAAIADVFRLASEAEHDWAATPPAARRAMLDRAAELMESRAGELCGLLVREAGKTLSAATSELREAVDFLRFYGSEAERTLARARPLGTVVCISPWNFPLAIFTGQVAAALAAGNVVVAKPAEETPLIAGEATALLRKAGVPAGALQLLPGDGRVGAALVADPRAQGVLFTGSTAAAKEIAKSLARRLGPEGRPVPLIAETGGRNAMIVDSSALPEQVVADVLASAFDSAGQRCSALRLLCLQEDVADRMLGLLRGAMAELVVGDPARLETDVGPVILADALDQIRAHVAAMRARGFRVDEIELPGACAEGTFAAPALIEIGRASDLEGEVFGPALHVLRYPRDGLDRLVEEIAASGHALTFGVHSRIEETVDRLIARAPAGNVYVNRTMIGAVVGSQPFGGHGLSGTGPKAGGPLYLRRLLAEAPAGELVGEAPKEALAFADWLDASGRPDLGARGRAFARRSPLGVRRELSGPVGERNVYALRPRGAALCRGRDEDSLFLQIAAALATGNIALIEPPPPLAARIAALPAALGDRVQIARLRRDLAASVVLVADEADEVIAALRAEAARPGPVLPVHIVPRADGDDGAPLEWLVVEVAVSVNAAAAGGDAGLIALGG